MLSLDKEASIKLFDVFGNLFTRFGSTRVLTLAFVLVFFGVIAVIDPFAAKLCAICGFVSFGLVLLSLHLDPHGKRV